MYQLLERKWSTSLFYCDPESCILAHCLPCHVYAKIYDTPNQFSCYFFNFMYYGLFYLCMYNSYYWLNIINHNKCPDSITDYCITLENQTCSQYYMLVNGIPSKCINENNICLHNDVSCYTNYNKLNMFLSLVGSFSYFILFFLNFFLREKVKKEYNIESNCLHDSSAILCTTCGLAQEYREIEIVIDV